MLIDWFTVAAQAVNFLVLVWLLKRFLYAPILGAIDAREKGIVARLADAEARKAEAQAEHDDFQRKNEALEKQRTGFLHGARDAADAERERLLGVARADAAAARSGWQNALRAERQELGDEVVRRTQEAVFDIARKTLVELATTHLEECMSDVFIARLRGLDGAAHDQIAASLRTAPQSALVRSAFDLPPAQRAAILAVIGETFAAQVSIRFETAPGLVSGIEMTTGGQKVAWSISDALASLGKTVAGLVEEKLVEEKTVPAAPVPTVPRVSP